VIDTIPLFAEPERPGVSPARTIPRAKNPTWSKYKGSRLVCDECVVFLHENRGVGQLPRSAHWVRRAAGESLRLCREHAVLRHVIDRGERI
jgi:hypothetical protein